MTTKDTEISDPSLINLIYHHLKDNGHEKAAVALKKHAPQVEAASGKVSLNDIFKKWMSHKREKKRGGGTLEAKVSKPKAARKAAHSIKNDKSQKKKRSKKKDKLSNLAEASTEAASDRASITLTAGDSDSDSSLDVEKWKRLAVELSDADIGKMDAFTKFSKTTSSSQEKSTKKRKPTQTKKDSSRNMKAKKAKTVTSPSKTKKTSTPLKSSINKDTRTVDKRKSTTLSKNLKDKGNFSEFLNVETPGIKFAKGLSEHTVSSKSERVNGDSETDSIKTPTKKVRHKKAQSFSESTSIETLTQTAERHKSDEHVKPEDVKTPRKNAKSKKTITFAEPLETPSRTSDTKTTISDESESCDLLETTFIDTPSKKTKSKKSVKQVETLNVDVHSEGVDHEITCIHTPSKKSKENYGLLSPKPDETRSKQSKKMKKSLKCTEPGDLKTILKDIETKIASSLLTPDQPETPSKKKKKKVLEPDPVEICCRKANGKKTDTSSELSGVETQIMEVYPADALSKATHCERPSKKSKHHTDNSFSESVLSETPLKKSKTKKSTKIDHVQSPSKKTSVDLGEEESSKTTHSQSYNTETASDKYACKISGCRVTNETTSASHTSKSPLKSALISAMQSAAQQHTYSPQTPIHDRKKKNKNKDEESIKASELEEHPTEPKKRKRDKEEKKKETERSTVEEELPPSEEHVDNLASSASKKKKKKKKYSYDGSPLSVPAHEQETPKKKKKRLNDERDDYDVEQ